MILLLLCLLGCKIFIQLDTYYFTTALVIWLYYYPKERIPNLNTFLRMQYYSSVYTAYNGTLAQGFY